MTRKKQIIIPIAILIIGILLFFGFSSMKSPPEEKAEVDNTPIVAVEEVHVAPMNLTVKSYGVVQPKYETELVAQISGEVVELADVFVRGGFVAKNQLLARIDPNDYQAALIDAEATMASARASLEKERAQGQVAEQEWKRITDTSPTELSLRKPQLAQELANVKSAQASVLRAKRNLERTEIRAPYDAMIESRMIGLGSFVGTGTKVGKLLGTGVAEVRLPVADDQLQFLASQGENAQVNLLGTFAGENITWSAKIARSEGVVDNKSRMTYLVAEVKDPYGLKSQKNVNKHNPIRFGSYVKAEIFGISLNRAALLPRYLVSNNRVAILDADSTLHYADIIIARQEGSNVIVTDGLKEGDQLIVSALDYPVDGMKLALQGSKSEVINQDALETQIASTKD
ncbi:MULTISPECIES: efflux RND transporter periplasmic adaptor subunit [unclassified Colwellia]|uniref:efflux RND transporter periplasmic adaptor subunit n=1 Tax=unclassified Colwellia TaxID=196834 RepID=UPI0015F485F7|nr:MULTISPECIES: efflux RND transporter periplasmic adaptor subunit [unclassified Colwellia]MBA6362143.1 efflux RND transporter periplasmic adaptor subunit [Colwellia sp. BRX8-8]MBA6352283.1 efflux RND transporter periplasmic adaptor subunit [Colwellia sp. BRX9-1]MBA6355950.1 efflux RND transporter periplasmic adaptor subunit [Colwellia sp. BRX8-3]MBA6359612.1 efflux RND transporter periplasmic adaptor subunit [Colwellia sp. BRX8-6]MBA6366199.1 efflux RND transporter periplasmic adaptor subuni